MPLTTAQQEIIFRSIMTFVDPILASTINSREKIEWLQLSIKDEAITQEDVIQILKENTSLTQGLGHDVNVPQAIRTCWQALLIHIKNERPPLPGMLIGLSKINNYNPFFIAQMRLFEEKIDTISELKALKNNLIALKEVYLQMTPLVSSSNPTRALVYFIRIGQLPFLETGDQKVLYGEIQEYISGVIAEKLAEVTQLEKQKTEAERKENREIKAVEEAGLESIDGLTEQQMMQAKLSDVFSVHQSFLSEFTELPINNDRLFNMQFVSLNNTITGMMQKATAKMYVLDTNLKQSRIFLELRVAECCNVLADVALEIVEGCCSDEKNFDEHEINSLYDFKLKSTYEMYLEDMVSKWMRDRKGWVSDSNGAPLTELALQEVSQKFKQDIENSIRKNLQSFKSFSFKAKSLRPNFSEKMQALQTTLATKKASFSQKALEAKKNWDQESLPLMSLADYCNQLRILRSKIQKNEECTLKTFNSIVTQLSKMGNDLEYASPRHKQAFKADFNLLHYACFGLNLKAVTACLAAGADLSLKDVDGNSMLHLAVENESKNTVMLLTLLRQEPFFKQLNLLELKNNRGKTPLHIAAAVGNLSAVQSLLNESSQKIADLAIEDKSQMMALHYAAREGKKEVLNYLLGLDGVKSIKMNDKNHPLVLAIQGGHVEAATVFFKHGIWLNVDQKSHLLSVAKQIHSPRIRKNIYYCLAIPSLEGLADLVRLPASLPQKALFFNYGLSSPPSDRLSVPNKVPTP